MPSILPHLSISNQIPWLRDLQGLILRGDLEDPASVEELCTLVDLQLATRFPHGATKEDDWLRVWLKTLGELLDNQWCFLWRPRTRLGTSSVDMDILQYASYLPSPPPEYATVKCITPYLWKEILLRRFYDGFQRRLLADFNVSYDAMCLMLKQVNGIVSGYFLIACLLDSDEYGDLDIFHESIYTPPVPEETRTLEELLAEDENYQFFVNMGHQSVTDRYIKERYPGGKPIAKTEHPIKTLERILELSDKEKERMSVDQNPVCVGSCPGCTDTDANHFHGTPMISYYRCFHLPNGRKIDMVRTPGDPRNFIHDHCNIDMLDCWFDGTILHFPFDIYEFCIRRGPTALIKGIGTYTFEYFYIGAIDPDDTDVNDLVDVGLKPLGKNKYLGSFTLDEYGETLKDYVMKLDTVPSYLASPGTRAAFYAYRPLLSPPSPIQEMIPLVQRGVKYLSKCPAQPLVKMQGKRGKKLKVVTVPYWELGFKQKLTGEVVRGPDLHVNLKLVDQDTRFMLDLYDRVRFHFRSPRRKGTPIVEPTDYRLTKLLWRAVKYMGRGVYIQNLHEYFWPPS